MFPDSGPTARALLTLELLQNRPGIGAAEIARRLDISERAARRTITILRASGIPIDGQRGPHGGYRLARGLNLPPLRFTAVEALGLVMAVLDGHHAADREDEAVGSALGKLISALPDNVGRQAALMRRHAQAAPAPDAARPDHAVTASLVAAVAESERVALTYRTQHRKWSEEVDPWGVVVRHGHWYLVCHSRRAGAIRTYRVDRVVEVTPTGVRFEPPADLDALAQFEANLAQGWGLDTRVVIDAPVASVKPWVGPAWGRLAPHPDNPDHTLLVGSTSSPDMYAGEWLARLPFPFTVEGGKELRASMSRLVERLSAAIAGPTGAFAQAEIRPPAATKPGSRRS